MIPLAVNAVFLAVSVLTYFVAVGFRISAWLLCGLHTYLLMDDSAGASAQQQEEPRSRKPSDGNNHSEGMATDGSQGPRGESLRERGGFFKDRQPGRARERAKEQIRGWKGSKKKKEKENLVWNDSGSQILRISIGDSHLENRKYYPEFDEAVIYSTLAMAALFTGELLNLYTATETENQGSISIYNGFVPFLVCLVSVYKLARLLAVVSWEKNLSTNFDWLLSCASGLLGFLLASVFLFGLPLSFVDSGLDKAISHADGAARLYIEKKGADHVPISIPMFVFAMKSLVAVMAGVLSALFLGPALRSVRCFWLGTDQLGWSLSITNRGSAVRTLLNLNMVLPLLTALLWIRPMTQVFVQDSSQKFTYESIAFHRYVKSLSLNNSGSTEESEHVFENSLIYSPVQYQDFGSTSRCMARDQDSKSSQPFSDFEGTIPDSPMQKGEKIMFQDTTKSYSKKEDNLNAAGSSQDRRNWNPFYIDSKKRAQIKGISHSALEVVKFCAVLSVVLLQLGLFRINMQTYFNGGVLVWYQSLHQSQAYDIELTKAKVLLVNYFMCRVTLQILAPGMLIILFSGMARSCESCIDSLIANGDYLFAPLLVTRELMLFLTWWTVSAWAALTCTILALFRLGFFLAT
ncbi:hypothetical protein O6H91_23G008400 [Diphasiastrum complanatum]|uniref:Uncharacterized protein n=2 Tax=Diphasiastrum complanatum TaxID=34168 RepID=A0ACC2A7X6_DIPCM|nr:hypothetical protein O6H91_23G008400 [Diphasiastrum complanatum]